MNINLSRDRHGSAEATEAMKAGPVVSDPEFLAQEAAAVASLIDQDEVDGGGRGFRGGGPVGEARARACRLRCCR